MWQLGELLATRISHINDNLAKLEQRVTDIESGGSSSGGSTEEGGESSGEETGGAGGTTDTGTLTISATFGRWADVIESTEQTPNITTTMARQRALTITIPACESRPSEAIHFNLERFVWDLFRVIAPKCYLWQYAYYNVNVNYKWCSYINGTFSFSYLWKNIQKSLKEPSAVSNGATKDSESFTGTDALPITGSEFSESTGSNKAGYVSAALLDGEFAPYLRYFILSLSDGEFDVLIAAWRDSIITTLAKLFPDLTVTLSFTNTSTVVTEE